MQHTKLPVIVSGNSGSGGFDWYPADTPFVKVIDRYQNEIAIWDDGEPTKVRLLLVEVPAELDGDTITDYLEGLSATDDLEFNLPAILEDVPEGYEALRLGINEDDWKYEVANGDTVLGFAEWVAHKVEADIHSRAAYTEAEANDAMFPDRSTNVYDAEGNEVED